jgi:hypothetical protein
MMGSSFGKSIGPRSGYRPDPSTKVEIDYRDPMHAEKAKRELYALFLDEKIAHVSALEEAQAEVKKLIQDRDRLQKLIDASAIPKPIVTPESRPISTSHQPK